MSSRQPIDNRDLRIFDLNVNESLENIAKVLIESNQVNGPVLEQININLSLISGALEKLIELYERK
jgi:hypothetical protein